jgi:hypothetical protein
VARSDAQTKLEGSANEQARFDSHNIQSGCFVCELRCSSAIFGTIRMPDVATEVAGIL